MEKFQLDEQSSSNVLRYRDSKKGITRFVRAEDKVMSALLTGSEDSLASTAWLRAFLEQGIDVKSLGQSLLLPVSEAPIALKKKSRAICNCFNVSEDTIQQCLSKMQTTSNTDEAMTFLQNETLCGTNCGSCKPEVKQMITLYLKSLALA
jgi:assimilatory nitrate reductase catalytic subunit